MESPAVGALDGKVVIVTGASRGIGHGDRPAVRSRGRGAWPRSRAPLEPGGSHLDGSLRETVADDRGGRRARRSALTADLADPAFDAGALVAEVERRARARRRARAQRRRVLLPPVGPVSARRYDVMFAVNVDATWELS